MKKIVVFGNNIIAQMLFEDVSRHSNEEVVVEAFTVDERFINGSSFCDKPLVRFEDIEKMYPQNEYEIISTVDAPGNLKNRLYVFERIKAKGYKMPNYLSPLADVSNSIVLGENNIVMAFAHVGAGGILGNANFIRQNTYLGHDFKIGSGNTISAGCTIAGFCTIGDSCFIGIGATIVDHLIIADGTFIGAGATVINNTESHSKYVGNPARLMPNTKI